MTRSDMNRTRVVRAWLDEGSTDLSPRVLHGILREFPGMDQDGPPWSPPRLHVTSFAAGAAVTAVGAVAVLVGAGLIGGTPPGGAAASAAPSARTESTASPGPVPPPDPIDRSYRDVGLTGLPPLSAIPSDPKRTDLVEYFWQAGRSDGPPYQGAAFLYADGRLIWNEYYGGVPPASTTGWLEQRVTAEGIALVRGLAVEQPGTEVRRLDTPGLASRLPAGAWADSTVRPYVPRRFGVCLRDQGPPADPSTTLAEKLDMLPLPIRVLLEDRAPVPIHDDVYGEGSDCLEVSTADARRLDAALREAGFNQDLARNRWFLEYNLDAPGPGWLGVWFEPVLPDGTITCSGCG
jgi:hypothetical protein